jgi:hypothetical protein
MQAESWIDQAWNRHADEPAVVAAELDSPAAADAADDAAVSALLRLSHHVHGAHLGLVAEGRAQLKRLVALPGAGDGARADAALFDASLAATGGEETLLAPLPPSTRARAQALAASNLCERDAVRASRLLTAAVAGVEAAALPDTDPAVRTLATTGHNVAVAMEERPSLNDAERALMLQAAAVSLAYWRRAGTWLHEERAHYRLAHSHRKAGDLAAARHHAQACLAIVSAHGDEALEVFFGCEALARIEAAEGRAEALAATLARQRAAFERLAEDDRGWCRATLEQVEQLQQLARSAGSHP